MSERFTEGQARLERNVVFRNEYFNAQNKLATFTYCRDGCLNGLSRIFDVKTGIALHFSLILVKVNILDSDFLNCCGNTENDHD